MRIIITGSRHWYCRELADKVIGSLIAKHGASNLVIVHGDCPTGVDAAFDAACHEVCYETIASGRHEAIVEVERHPADWKRYLRGAGPRRNQEMVDAGADLCLAFHPDLAVSNGTGDCVRRALEAGIPTWLTHCETAIPIRQSLAGVMDSINQER
jgi:hypothetical protein